MKATKTQLKARVEEVLRIRLDGAEFWDVREYAREKEQEAGSAWELPAGGKPLSDGQLWRYIAQADKLIAESCRASRNKLFRRHLAQRRNLFAKAVSAGDYRTALAVARDEAELHGLYPPKKIAPTNPKGDKPYEGVFSDAERAAALASLYARLGSSGGVPPAGGEAVADGSFLAGPDADSVGRGDEARPVASGPPSFFGPTDSPVMHPASGEIDGSVCFGGPDGDS